MKDFSAYFTLEMKRFMSGRNILAWLIILLLLILQANAAAYYINNIPLKIKKHKQIQDNYFEITANYELYSRDGIKFLFIFSPACLLSNSTLIPPDLAAKVDSLVTVQIFNNFKGKSLVRQHNTTRLDIEGIISLLISLLALWYGFQSLYSRGYVMFLSSLRTDVKTFCCIVIARLILFFGAFFCVISMVYIVTKLRGVEFSLADHVGLGGSLLAALVMLLAFFFIGVFTGTFGRRPGTYIFLLAAWGILNFGVPWALGEAFEPRFPDSIIDYQTELDKYALLMDFEKKCEEKAGIFDRDELEVEREFAETYWNIDYKKINTVETGLKKLFRDQIRTYNTVCMFFPTTFFRQTVNEASSGGYINFLRFYDYVQEMQGRFVRFYIDRTYYNDVKQMVNFIKDDEDIFRAKSDLPAGYGLGIAINLVYVFMFLFASYYRFKRMLFPGSTDAPAYANINIALKGREIITIGTDRKDFIRQWVKLFFGRSRGLTWKVTLDNESIITGKRWDIIYIPCPGNIPGELKGRELVDLFQRLLQLPAKKIDKINEDLGTDILNKQFCEMEPLEKARIVLILVMQVQKQVYLFDDFAAGIPANLRQGLEKIVQVIPASGTLIIDIVFSECYWLNPDRQFTIAYKKGEYRVF